MGTNQDKDNLKKVLKPYDKDAVNTCNEENETAKSQRKLKSEQYIYILIAYNAGVMRQ